MQRLFFHNQHDKDSTAILAGLDESVQVYDVFARGTVIPDGITLHRLPYMIDKYIALDTAGPYYTGIVNLGFSCNDYQDTLLMAEDRLFIVTINGVEHQDYAANGVIAIELTCDVPITVPITIKDVLYGYLPCSCEIEVVAGD